MKKEHNFSIKNEYLINSNLFKYFLRYKDKTVPNLSDMFTKIVKPMTDDIRKLMEDNNLMNESELFISDLSFRAHSSKKGVMIGDESKKDESVIQFVTDRLKKLTKEYTKKFKDFKLKVEVEKAKEDEIKALVIYIACYYNHRNPSLKDQFAHLTKKKDKDGNFCKEKPDFEKFCKEKEKEFNERNS